ncbi:hypothetical protein AB0395_12115 [Streptosporangium sp. NPDC051023]|uniref:hypothetical protein n=1 Tax=Streptosporangium sp. NPDC051023 TaxID=3155410 RepID=UPI00344F550B
MFLLLVAAFVVPVDVGYVLILRAQGADFNASRVVLIAGCLAAAALLLGITAWTTTSEVRLLLSGSAIAGLLFVAILALLSIGYLLVLAAGAAGWVLAADFRSASTTARARLGVFMVAVFMLMAIGLILT